MIANVWTRLRDVRLWVEVAVVIGIVIAITTYYASFSSHDPQFAN